MAGLHRRLPPCCCSQARLPEIEALEAQLREAGEAADNAEFRAAEDAAAASAREAQLAVSEGLSVNCRPAAVRRSISLATAQPQIQLHSVDHTRTT